MSMGHDHSTMIAIAIHSVVEISWKDAHTTVKGSGLESGSPGEALIERQSKYCGEALIEAKHMLRRSL
jgi:hypothetical protein